MNLSDTFYVALCMTVLIIGVVYWFWTQNQYIQRKLNLLENIVYDMKSSMQFNSGEGTPDPVEKALAAQAAATVTYTHPDVEESSVPKCGRIDDEDDVDKILDSIAAHTANSRSDTQAVSDAGPGPTLVTEDIDTTIVADEHLDADDLQPGGITAIDGDVSDTSNESVLNAMGMKELRELAKQKNINGAKTMRKHELVAAIRASKTNVTPFEIREGTLDLN